MPPKRTAGRATKAQTNEKAGSFGTYEKRMEKSNDIEPFVRSVVVNLMFASGDAEHPLQENEDMVVDLLKNELVLLFDDIRAIHDVHQFKLSHIVSVLRTQKGILSRFLKYLENRVQMAAFMRSKSFANQNVCGQELDSDDEKNNRMDDGVDPMDEIGDVEGAEGEYLKKKRKKLGNATAEEALLQEVQKTFSDSGINVENYQDDKFETQLATLQNVIRNMSIGEYSRYSVARRTSFQLHSVVLTASASYNPSLDSRKRKMSTSTNNRRTLLTWIGEPPVTSEAALVFVAFLAKEIVSEIVGAAITERHRRNPILTGPLLNCYYEELLRKNQNFRKFGRLLL